jgi:hypothetical protein
MRWTAGQAMKLPPNWLVQLELLPWRFSFLGIGPDLAGMSVCELAGLFAYLARHAAGGR